MLVLLAVLLIGSQLGEISPFFCNSAWRYNLQDDVGVVACVAVGQPAGWGGGLAPQLRGYRHDTTICRMMLVLLAVLLLGSQVGEVVGLPPNYEDIDMSVDQAKGEKVWHFSINLQLLVIIVYCKIVNFLHLVRTSLYTLKF